MLFDTNFTGMSDADLKRQALSFAHLHLTTGGEGYKRLADLADAERERRMLSEPNPYETQTMKARAGS